LWGALAMRRNMLYGVVRRRRRNRRRCRVARVTAQVGVSGRTTSERGDGGSSEISDAETQRLTSVTAQTSDDSGALSHWRQWTDAGSQQDRGRNHNSSPESCKERGLLRNGGEKRRRGRPLMHGSNNAPVARISISRRLAGLVALTTRTCRNCMQVPVCDHL